MESDGTEHIVSVEVCDDPIDIGLMTIGVECGRCGSDERIVAMLRFLDFPDCGFLAVCGQCYRELIKFAVGRVV
jgi:hypothetical protein